MRIENPMLGDLAFESEPFTVGGENEFYCGSVEADAMIEWVTW
jgi:hypothetical protein